MTENQSRDDICRVGKSLFDRGYVHATAGNISVKIDDGFLITPTDACLGSLDPKSIAKLDPNGLQISGDKASKTQALHRQIYACAHRFDPLTRCIIHAHSTHCVALTVKDDLVELLAPITPYFVMKVGHVPVIAYSHPGSAQAIEDAIRVINTYGEIGTPIRAVMLSKLGPTVWHQSPALAMAVLEEIEETAKLTLLAPESTALTDNQINTLRQQFGARW